MENASFVYNAEEETSSDLNGKECRGLASQNTMLPGKDKGANG